MRREWQKKEEKKSDQSNIVPEESCWLVMCTSTSKLSSLLLLTLVTTCTAKATLNKNKLLLLRSTDQRREEPIISGTLPSTSLLGSIHRCAYTGKAYPVARSLTSRQLDNSEEFYYGKSREEDFYQHLFVESECSNGLPPSEHACFSTLRVGRHCGPDEDWSVIAPDEFDGPGVMWRNNAPCDGEEGVHKDDVTVVADFFCPTEPECIHLHRCSFEGTPNPSTPATAAKLSAPGTTHGQVNTNTGYKDVSDGYFEHVFTPEECSNGLPPVAGGAGSSLNTVVDCMTSIRWTESCGGDHDWEAFSTDEGGAGMRWYTSHTCDRAKIAVDYFCPAFVNKDDPSLHRCQFKGNSDVVADTKNLWCDFPTSSPTAAHGIERHAGDPAPGFCVQHTFVESECTNGLPPNEQDCIASRKRIKECGAEQDWTIVGPTKVDSIMKGVDDTYEKMQSAAGVMWYNAIETGPCGPAELTVDYFCPKK